MLGALYVPHTTIKGQVLADFVAEFIESMIDDRKGIVDIMIVSTSVVPTVYSDGMANWKGAGVGIVVITPEKLVMEKSLWFSFLATNNEAEYEALFAGLAMVNQLRGEVVEVYLDSRLVVGQVNGKFEA